MGKSVLISENAYKTIAPVSSLRAALHIRPDKPALLQPSGKKAGAQTIMPDDLQISDLRPLKTKRCPDNGSCFSTSCTRSAKEGKPQRMSV